MRGVWLFLHYMGFAAWVGGGLAMMLAGITAKHFPPEERLAVYRATSVVARNLVGPGALLVLVSGFVLSLPFFKTAIVQAAVEVHQPLLEPLELAADLLELAEAAVDLAGDVVDLSLEVELLARFAPVGTSFGGDELVLRHQVLPSGIVGRDVLDDPFD